MKTFIVHYEDGWLYPDTFEVQADNEQEALEKATVIMNSTTLDQNNIQAIIGVEEKTK